MVSAFFSLLVTRLDARNREKRIKVRKRVIQLLKKKKLVHLEEEEQEQDDERTRKELNGFGKAEQKNN